MGILFSCCMNANDSQTEHPDASIPKNDSCSPSTTSEPLEDRNSDGNQPNIVVLSAPQSYSELDVAVSTGMCDNQVAEPQVTALVNEDLLDTQIEGMLPCCEETPKICPYLVSDEEPSLPDLCNQLYQLILSPDEEDVCPTCLEDYDPNNPKIVTECSHHFHLSCIYAWMERSNTCPICYRVMVFDEAA
ncbi:uncharacterized protein LOC141602582 [Silene latifolia]|uniref:uncharacterized protein LOC141602582 n=1 Tax=Silene latifolia TaxID=37657 RepID=UPI003D7879AB